VNRRWSRRAARKSFAVALAIITTMSPGVAAPVTVAAAIHVAGLSLLTTSDEAVEALRLRHLPIKALIKSGCVSDYLAMHRDEVPMSDRDGHCVESIQAAYAGGSLLLFFTEDMPRRPRVSVLTTIALNYPTDDSVMSRVIADAGPPTLTDGERPWTIAMWCFGFACTNMDRALQDRFAGPMLLVHQGAGFTLEDAGAANRRQAAMDRILASHGVRRMP